VISVLNDFEERVKEVELYFEHLDLIFGREAELFLPNNKTQKRKKIKEELKKVLKANCFLLLYNLSESSIRQALTVIFEEISNKELKYNLVKSEIKKIWIELKYKNFKDKGSEEIFNILSIIADDIIDITFEDKGLGGNVDGQKIRLIANELGFSIRTHHSLKKGVNLHLVKTQRNKLARGNISFAKCGREYSPEDLIKIKNQVIKYRRSILINIKTFIEAEEFVI
jgi:MAE_28990/MAE_18760-like HEPN